MRILIVDDHALIREGISLMIHAVRPDAEIVQAVSCSEGIAAAASGPFDLALVDPAVARPCGGELDRGPALLETADLMKRY